MDTTALALALTSPVPSVGGTNFDLTQRTRRESEDFEESNYSTMNMEDEDYSDDNESDSDASSDSSDSESDISDIDEEKGEDEDDIYDNLEDGTLNMEDTTKEETFQEETKEPVGHGEEKFIKQQSIEVTNPTVVERKSSSRSSKGNLELANLKSSSRSTKSTRSTRSIKSTKSQKSSSKAPYSTRSSKSSRSTKSSKSRRSRKLKRKGSSFKKDPPLELAWDFSLEVPATKAETVATGKSTKTLLNNVCGSVKGGDMVAVMGSSGAGKSTFLDCVSLRNQKFDGNVFVNGQPANESYYFMSGFVYQEDLFIPTMTVREHLVFNAMVRMNKRISVAKRLQRVEELIVDCALNHISETFVGGPGAAVRGVSGGERKRVAFATELLNDPRIIFADEPTSGLDSYMTNQMCGMMRALANRGKIIMCVIHQPSSQTFNLFSHLLLLAKGKTVYLGKLTEMDNYFEKMGVKMPPFYNPADFYIQQLSIIPSKQVESWARLNKLWSNYSNSYLCHENNKWKDEVSESLLLQKRKYVSMQQFNATTWQQFKYTFERNMNQLQRSTTELKAKFFNAVFMGLILGSIYYNQDNSQGSAKNLLGLFFIFTMYQTMTSMFGVVNTFPSEVKVFIRENLSGANRLTSYFLARTFAEVPTAVVFPTIFSTIVYWLVFPSGKPIQSFLAFVLTMVVLANCSVSVGTLISSMTKHEAVAMALAPLFLMPMALFAGLLLDLDNIPGFLRWIDFISIIKYGYQMLIINEYDDKEMSCTGHLFCRYPSGSKVIDYVGTDSSAFTYNLGIMLFLMVAFRVAALGFLKLKAMAAQ